MRGLGHPLAALASMRGHLFPMAPVALAIGIGLYFALPDEPGAGALAALAVTALAGAALWWFGPEDAQPVFAGIALVCLGVLLAAWRSHAVAEPVLGWRYYGAIEGRIVEIDRSSSDRVRLTLDEIVLERLAPERRPARVRVSLHGDQGFVDPVPGKRVILTGHLSAPGPPSEPGGFDFRRMAWFQGLGAVGYTRTPVLALAPVGTGDGLGVTRMRHAISEAVRARMPGQPGAFAAAILTGDRSGIESTTTEDLRAANLSHLLAISGLHMGLLTGFVFAALRYGLALVPPLALRVNIKKLAALLALAAAGFYLALSGGNVATQRAFVMVSVILVAVLLDRRAISLRSVAIAALIILAARPEELVSAGFQMSFAATTALVAVFGWLRTRPHDRWRAPRWLAPILGVAICSIVAGLATGPVAAAAFNRIAGYGLVANLLSVPLMGSVVMPAAVFAGLLAPLGLSWLPLAVMELGTRWILGVAHWVAGLEGALRGVVEPPGWVLPVLALGVLGIILWRSPARWAGVPVMALALAGWSQAERPALLVSEPGTLIGLMTPQGRVLSKPTGEGFAASVWLEHDGDLADQARAHARAGLGGREGALRFDLAGREIVHITGRGARARLDDHCAPGALVILGNELDAAAAAPAPPRTGTIPLVALTRLHRAAGTRAVCAVIDRSVLAQTGVLAIHVRGGDLVAEPTRRPQGGRPWTAQ